MDNRIIDIRGKRLDFDKKTYVMGILNVTPDSFSDGGKYQHYDAAMRRIEEMIAEGADIIDIGAESTRPGAKPLSAEEELHRISEVVRGAAVNFDTVISIDTYKSQVAEETLKLGAHIINDISGMTMDDKMAEITAKYDCAAVLMHMQGKPESMQTAPKYNDIIEEIKYSLEKSIKIAQDAGLKRENIILDPGIGFGKKLEHNLEIIRRLDIFCKMGYPVLLGASRKSFIGVLTNAEADDRLAGSLAAAVLGAAHGAGIVRVHDVQDTVRALKVTDAIIKG